MDTGLSSCPFYMKSFLNMAILWLYTMRMWWIKLSLINFFFPFWLVNYVANLYSWSFCRVLKWNHWAVSHKWIWYRLGFILFYFFMRLTFIHRPLIITTTSSFVYFSKYCYRGCKSWHINQPLWKIYSYRGMQYL